MKILTVVDARPQFIRAAVFSRALLARDADGSDDSAERTLDIQPGAGQAVVEAP